ncbi:MAG: iron ABC transporter permease [Alphaproteobacteria bacterium]|nr:iron ABC transporter permease [Alphaproteobacteria bacterium]MDE2111640.1 iron ABC transporter permease [Alphaproteobacteria bacterium]MDE2494248.1 iron ABC transporter permease [Alphaproteobacteria bacterium]
MDETAALEHKRVIGDVPRVTLVLAVLALGFACWSFLLGPSDLSAGALFKGLFSGHGEAGVVAQQIRLPRAALALVIGAALGGSGAALQGLFCNPLASPDVTGVTSTACLGAVCALYFGFASSNALALPAFAIVGALAAAAILYFLSRSGAGAVALILAGVAIASFATALTALALSLAHNPYAMSEMVLWMMGSLKDRTLNDLIYALPLVVMGLALLLTAARGLDALTLGEDAARSLGVDVTSVRGRVIVGVALATGAATAVAGSIGFVGLVVPHLLRPFCGYQPARLILPSALGGAALVVAADVALRLLAPDGQLLLGVVTSLLGAPFFLWLILQLRRDA